MKNQSAPGWSSPSPNSAARLRTMDAGLLAKKGLEARAAAHARVPPEQPEAEDGARCTRHPKARTDECLQPQPLRRCVPVVGHALPAGRPHPADHGW
eukprot:scaffold60064_cov55-Phaeocystis_antarctica.AAC.4